MKLNYKQTIFVGLAFLSISAFWQFYYAYMPLTVTLVFGLDNFWRGVVMGLDNFVALIMLPLFGMLSDKRKNVTHGRRTPYILIGTFLCVVFFMAMGVLEHMQFEGLMAEGAIRTATEGLDAAAKKAVTESNRLIAFEFMQSNPAIFVGFIGFVLLTLFSMGIYRTPAVALMPDVTPKPLRSQANAVINIMGGAGGVLATVIFTLFIKDYESKMTAYALTAGLMVVAIIVYMIVVNEPKSVAKREETEKEHGIFEQAAPGARVKMKKPEFKSFMFLLASIAFWFIGYYAVYSSFTVYANNNLGVSDGDSGIFFLIAMGVAAAGFIPIAYFSAHAGRKKTILGGIVLLGISLAMGFFVTPDSIWLMYVLFPLVGVGWAAINVNSFPMVAEMAPSLDVGRFTGYYYAASMSAQGLAPIISGFFMDAVGETALFPIAALFVALSFVTMLFVKHGDSKPIKGKN
ncbi:MAG: MFS transporter [Clostridiales bacterium]|jgi:Na+/melibiose symporter-like transporter|nr:MFS transporter [Clostridiales bacterium]